MSFSSPESLSRMHKPPAFERKISRECYRSLFSFLLSSPRDSSYKFEKDGAERIHRTGDKDPERATFPPSPLSNLSEWNYPEGRRISKKTFFSELEGSLKFPTTPITSPGNKNYCCEKKKGEREREKGRKEKREIGN